MNILNLISLKLNELPNDNCLNLGTENNTANQKVTTYRLLLDKKEMGLFDTLEINAIEGNGKSFVFSTLENPVNNLNRVKQLVNDLFKIYGEDQNGVRDFNAKDEMNLREGYWNGRMYVNTEKHRPPSMLNYSDSGGLTITVWLQ